jgi:hypothetical protein
MLNGENDKILHPMIKKLKIMHSTVHIYQNNNDVAHESLQIVPKFSRYSFSILIMFIENNKVHHSRIY